MNRISLIRSSLYAAILMLGATVVVAQKEDKPKQVQEVKLNLKIEGIESPEGRLQIAVYRDAKDFLKMPFRAYSLSADSVVQGGALLRLPLGTYSIAIFHDENGNGRLDTGSFGIPTEKYGFSNTAERLMGPPNFKSTSFELRSDTTQLIALQ